MSEKNFATVRTTYHRDSCHQLVSRSFQLSNELDDTVLSSVLQPDNPVALLQDGLGLGGLGSGGGWRDKKIVSAPK